MKVAVVGAGIIGVTTAYELAALGHEVIVYERRSVVAAEASFANAGVVSPSSVAPWAAPGMPWKVLRQLLGRHAPVRLAGQDALAHLPWMWHWWRACRAQAYAANRTAMQRLAQFSRDRLLELTRSLRLEYEQTPGFVMLLRSAADLKSARGSLTLMRELGVPHELIDAARCRQIEPGLNAAMALHAPVGILVCGEQSLEKYAGYWVLDCAAATENLLLAVVAKGLGAVWCGVYPKPDRVEGFARLLGIPAHVTPFAFVPIGHPDESKPPARRYNPERVHNDRW